MSIVISKKNKFIFFHLPKNAGSAVSNLLNKNEKNNTAKIIFSKVLKKFTKKDNFFFDNLQNRFHFYSSHVRVSYIQSLISPQIFNEYFKFAVVRNPYGRFVSRYNYTKLISKNKNLEFEKFLKDHIKHNLIADHQYKFLLKNDGNIGVNKILKFENLDNDLKEISNVINVKIDNFKQINISTFDDYKNYYNSETKMIVKNFCKDDLEYFNYDF